MSPPDRPGVPPHAGGARNTEWKVNLAERGGLVKREAAHFSQVLTD
jgi:hypothetical protein